MKLSNLFLLLFLCITTACNAQKKMIEIVNCTKGNTGFRGIVPKEDMHKPNQGKDFYALSLKATKKCTVEIVSLTVKENDTQILLKPTFDNGTIKMSLAAGETGYLRVEKEENAPALKPKIKGAGSLVLKINGKKNVFAIEKFDMILPQ